MLEINLSEEEKAWLSEAKKLIDNKKWKESYDAVLALDKNNKEAKAGLAAI